MTLLKPLLCNKCKSAQLTATAIVKTTQLVNEYFGVGVVSEPWMA